MEPFHLPIVFHDDSQSATSPDVFQILKEYPIDRDIQKYNEREGEIHLADGSRTTITGRVSLPITLQGRTLVHTFSILPTLESPALMGMDL